MSSNDIKTTNIVNSNSNRSSSKFISNNTLQESKSKKSSLYSSSKSSFRSNIKKVSTVVQKKKESETNAVILDCKFCNLGINYIEYFKHLEYSCNNFKTFPIISNYSIKEKQQFSKININSKTTPFTESMDPEYQAREMQEHKNCFVASNTKEHRPNKKLVLIKEIELPNLAIGQIHLKSYQFCVFGLCVKNRYIKYYIAYRGDSNGVEVIDLLDNSLCASLRGHLDLVTEIKYFKTKKEYNLLLTSSYDSNLLIWEISTFKMVKKINNNSWVLSSIILNYNDQELVFIAGGYSKNTPIKCYELESGDKQYEINLNDDVIPIIIEKYTNNKYTYLFVGTDAENPKFYIIDYSTKMVYKSFNLKNTISAICLFSTNTSQLFAYTSDYLGLVSEFDVNKGKLNTEFSVGTNTLDLITYDDYYLMSCGDRNNSIKSVIRHKHRVGKAFIDIHSKVILNIQKFLVTGYGNCLFTLSADKKIKMFKF